MGTTLSILSPSEPTALSRSIFIANIISTQIHQLSYTGKGVMDNHYLITMTERHCSPATSTTTRLLECSGSLLASSLAVSSP